MSKYVSPPTTRDVATRRACRPHYPEGPHGATTHRPSAQGRVQPVKTMLRPDRRGLGSRMPQGVKYRVTHFPAHSEDQAKRSADGRSKAMVAHDGAEVCGVF